MNASLGWATGQRCAYGESFLFDNARLYAKWLEILESQKEDGAIPDVAPAFWRYYSDNMTWPGTMLLITEMLYNQTGDNQPYQENYPAMKKWLAYMQDRYMKDYILTKDSYGDWCMPPITIETERGKSADKKYPSAFDFNSLLLSFTAIDDEVCATLPADNEAYKSIELLVKISKMPLIKNIITDKRHTMHIMQ